MRLPLLGTFLAVVSGWLAALLWVALVLVAIAVDGNHPGRPFSLLLASREIGFYLLWIGLYLWVVTLLPPGDNDAPYVLPGPDAPAAASATMTLSPALP